jgi:phosphoribosylaminoimidazolecarboxamide formyltransferase/IMP cyclohydrolase
MRAIVSVHDKSGLATFAKGLEGLGAEIFSTGGTQRALAEAGVKVTGISSLTGFPEIMDGRVKTLHPKVFGGILARRDTPAHLSQLTENSIGLVDIVVVNLYPFRQTVSKEGVTMEEALENIDIGGPSLIRAAAKNHPYVLVVVDPTDYDTVLEALQAGEVGLDVRRHLAWKAFQHTATYDSFISRYLAEEEFPPTTTLPLKKVLDLRYGENPHQRAAFYEEEQFRPGLSLATMDKLAGKELSYNNLLDIDGAIGAAIDFQDTAVVVVKHTNPCGLATHPDLTEAYRRALAGDPVAAFGGVVAFNRPVDLATAEEMVKTHYDIVIAPEYAPDALSYIQSKVSSIVLAVPSLNLPGQGWELRRVRGGVLAQSTDVFLESESSPEARTKRKPTPQELTDLKFGWQVVKHIKSNAIVLVKDGAVMGMGAGQPSRVASVEIAVKKAGEKARGSVAASDAFFPFPDGVEAACQAGVTAIIQPGGSVRDKDAVEMADKYGAAMVFTGVRHFRH